MMWHHLGPSLALNLVLIFATSIPLLISPAQAEKLPPYWQRNKEIKSIVSNSEISTLLMDPQFLNTGDSTGLIDTLEFTGPLPQGQKYRITSGKCTLDVWVQYESIPRSDGSGLPGLVQFTVHSGPTLQCPQPK